MGVCEWIRSLTNDQLIDLVTVFFTLSFLSLAAILLLVRRLNRSHQGTNNVEQLQSPEVTIVAVEEPDRTIGVDRPNNRLTKKLQSAFISSGIGLLATSHISSRLASAVILHYNSELFFRFLIRQRLKFARHHCRPRSVSLP